MPGQIQCFLQFAREPLQIPYPQEWQGEKSNSEEEEIFISTEPRWLTQDEKDLVQAFVAKLPYRQELATTGATLVGNDPLLNATHEQLDKIERENGLLSTNPAPGGGKRAIRERVYIIRENGYSGNGNKALAGAT